jgi:hypothetical protein
MACMDKFFYLSHRTTVAIENSQDDLNDKSLFGSLKTDQNLIEEGNIVLGSNLNNSANNDEDEIVLHKPPPVTNSIDNEHSNEEGSDDETQTPSNITMSLAHQVTCHWHKCKQRIEHEYSIAAWALCVMGSEFGLMLKSDYLVKTVTQYKR